MTSGNGAFAGLTTDELRAAVRAVLRDLLPEAVTDSRRAPVGAAEEVVLRTEADLGAFVRRVAALCDDPGQRAAFKDGRRQFRLAGTATPAAGPTAAGATLGAMVRVERGAVTERTVKRAAAEGARVVVGPKAVLTPLARDRARALGVRVEREER